MGSSNRGVTNVKLTLRVNHPATDKMKLSFAFMTGLASAQYAQPMYQQQPAMGGMGNNMLLPLLLMDGGLGGSGSSNDLLLPLMLMGGMGGAGGDMGGMNGLLPLLLWLLLQMPVKRLLRLSMLLLRPPQALRPD